MRIRRVCIALCLAGVVALAVPGRAGAISTAGVITQTLRAAFSCMAWQPVGLCFWLRCTPFGCSVETSLKIGHYAPDLVVGAYNEAGGHPWTEAGAVLGLVERAAVDGVLGALLGVPGGAGMNRHKAGNRSSLIYRDVAAIGHPLTLLIGAGFQPSGVMAFGQGGVLNLGSGMLSFSDVAAIPSALRPYFSVMHPCAVAGTCPAGQFTFGSADSFRLETRWIGGEEGNPGRQIEGFAIPNPVGSTEGGDATVFVERIGGGFRWPLGGIAGVAFGVNFLGGFLCPVAGARPLFPHFVSGLDALAWRGEIPEILYPASLLPGLREIGQWPLHSWGSVYPRSGWVTQTDEPKAAAVLAQRAGDIVTRVGQPHVYVPVGTGGTTSAGGMRVWLPPYPLDERDDRGGKWQMLSPIAEGACRRFGTNDLAALTSWGGGRVDPGGDYAWNLWRPYRCCSEEGLFLLDVDLAPFP